MCIYEIYVNIAKCPPIIDFLEYPQKNRSNTFHNSFLRLNIKTAYRMTVKYPSNASSL